MNKSGIDVSVYYFPNYHVDPRNEKAHGKNWTEWELMKNNKPRFEGHFIPKPAWGYEDESKPEVMEKKIEAASKNGITNFIFDWYHYDNGPFLNRCLEEGFLKAKNTNDLKFSLMWANHDWVDIHPATYVGLDYPLVLDKGHVTKETFEKIMDYVIEKYFVKENYYRLDGGLYFSIYDINIFIESMGGIDEVKKEFEIFRKKVADAGLGKLHLNAVTWACRILSGESMQDVTAQMLLDMGFDSTTSYVWVHEHPLPKFPSNEYIDWFNESKVDFVRLSKKFEGITYYPNVTVGWDASARMLPSDMFVNKWYPFMGVIINNTPELFKKALEDCKQQLLASNLKSKMVTINAWNEWTEGSYLEPDDRYGDAKLKVIGEVFN